MPSREGVKSDGVIRETLSNAKFRVELESWHVVTAHPCGQMRRFFISIIAGDAVTIELSPHDSRKGRIMFLRKK